jgi:hypothetical protein
MRDDRKRQCALYFTKEQDGLRQDWGSHRVFCNPPLRPQYRRMGARVLEASQGGALVVLFVPARTDTKWFHEWVQGKADVTFVRGRLRFGGADTSAPFPSMLSVYSPERPAKVCARCGKGFVGRSDAQTCSNACRQALYRNRESLRLNRNGGTTAAEGFAR